MKKAFILLLILFIGNKFSYSKNVYQTIDKSMFYAILKSENLDEINNELSKVESSNIKEKEAYKGTLLMRKAGLLKLPIDKLHTFKKGAIALETAIANDSNNTEYRFLRLIIQEHAPRITKYNKQINDDAAFIKAHYKTLQPAVQQALIDYAKSSNVLHPQDFN